MSLLRRSGSSLPDTLIEPFRPLTDDEEEMVANAFSNSNRRKVLALGSGFAQFSQPVFQRCLDIIQTQQLAKVYPVTGHFGLFQKNPYLNRISKEISHDTSEISPSELDEQVKVDSHEGTVTEADKDKYENFPSEKSDQDNMEHPSSLEVQENGVIEDITVLPSHKDMDTVHAAEQDITVFPWFGLTHLLKILIKWKKKLPSRK
ncbi:hypothetical protein LXL04_023525 [Taraxacum kok-saghyz]